MDLLGITALYIFLYVPILWICTYPVYLLNKKTKSKVNPFLMRLELQFLGSSLSSLVRVLLGGIYIIFFGLLYCIVFFSYLGGGAAPPKNIRKHKQIEKTPYKRYKYRRIKLFDYGLNNWIGRFLIKSEASNISKHEISLERIDVSKSPSRPI